MNNKRSTLIIACFFVFASTFAQQITSKVLTEPVKSVSTFISAAKNSCIENYILNASDFPTENTHFYVHKGWLAINPNKNKSASTETEFRFEEGKYDLIFSGVGEYDGESEYTVFVNEKKVVSFKVPLSKFSYEEGISFCKTAKNIQLRKGDKIKVFVRVGTTDGKEYSRARWGGIILVKAGNGDNMLNELKNIKTTEILDKTKK